ncbi:MAG: AAA family ATPase [Planctomycetota bacterium]
MKITSLEVEGFRSFKSQTWCPGDLNLLIGPNASGKSNLLRVLEMVSVGARGGLGKWVQQEGGIDPLLWDGQVNELKVRFKTTPADFGRDTTRDSLTYELQLVRLGQSSSFRIDYEMLGNFYRVEQGSSSQPFKLIERTAGRGVLFDENEHSLVAPEASIPDDETLLSQVSGPFTQNRDLTEYQKQLSTWKIHQGFHTHREAAIRLPQVTRTDTQVSADGQNLISVLHSLYMGSREFKNEINTAMRAAFGDDFEELVFPPAADQRIQLRVRWRSLRREQSAADLSDGTLRFLFLLAVLANPSPPPLIAIDEPETGLHPSMLPIVAEYARDAADRSQVILTTHSAELLDAFGNDPPTTTVVERVNGETILRVIAGEQLNYWLQQYTLGDLYRSKELEAMQ